ncbi:TPA: acyltransferase [Enterobacter mori]|nr:acyltransferase [Enterobacter mori]HDR2779021.1 acyltransferase [Enterobacter mori]
MNTKSNSNRAKLDSVEGVRGIACFMVLLSHLSLIFFPFLHGENASQIKTIIEPSIYSLPLGFVYSGTAAVYIFFCLSGFILTYACSNKGSPLDNAAKMLSYRYIRLALPTFTSILICSLIIYFFKESANGLPWISGYGANASLELFDILYNALFSAVITGDNTYNWVVWTMQIELFGSILIFMAVPLLNKFKHTWLILIILGFIVIINIPTKAGYGYAAFLFGSSLYYAPSIKNNLFTFVLFFAGFYFGGFHYKQDAYSSLIAFSNNIFDTSAINYYYFYNMLSGILVVSALIKSNVFNWLSSNIVSVWLGKVSFSAYLIQMPVYLVISPLQPHIATLVGGSYLLSAILTCVLCIFVIYILSIVFYELIDKKSILLSKKGIALIRKHNQVAC